MENKNKSFKKGFTFIELLLVIALVLILSVPTAIFSIGMIRQSSVRDASEAIVEMIQESQSQSMSGKNNSPWGVKYESSKFILFSGENFLSRNNAFDRDFKINPNVSVTGIDEIVFAPATGRPAQSNYDIEISWGNVHESFHVNSEGVVE